MSIKFADMIKFLWRERMGSVMKCESVTMTLLRLDYLVYNLDNYIDDTSTETGLKQVGHLYMTFHLHFVVVSWCYKNSFSIVSFRNFTVVLTSAVTLIHMQAFWVCMDVDVDANAAIDFSLSYGSFGSSFPNTFSLTTGVSNRVILWKLWDTFR